MSNNEATEEMYGLTDEELLAYEPAFRSDLLKDQVALVSGGGTGIGKAIALMFGRLGAKVVICSRNIENLSTTQDLLEQADIECDVHTMTIRDPEQVDALMNDIWDKYGRMDILVNNAGGQFPQESIDFAAKGWNAVIDTNLSGPFYMMQAAARMWKKHGQPGSIVNIIADFWRGMPQIAHTSAARAAVSNLAMSLGVEWAPLNIRVNCIAPGVIETSGLNVYPEESRRNFHLRNVMHRLGTVNEVAEAVVYIGGPTGSFITGETLTIDGGQFMWGQFWPYEKPDYFQETNGSTL